MTTRTQRPSVSALRCGGLILELAVRVPQNVLDCQAIVELSHQTFQLALAHGSTLSQRDTSIGLVSFASVVGNGFRTKNKLKSNYDLLKIARSSMRIPTLVPGVSLRAIQPHECCP